METTNTIKGIEVIAYKGMESDMTCRDFQYELGKTYKTDKVKFCNCGFHACLNPRDVFGYYPQEEGSRYFKVLLSGEITKCDEFDTKVVATKITILEEIPSDKFLTNIEWWKNDNVLDLLYWSEGFARVQKANGECNFVDKQGNYLFNEWFVYVYAFNEGFARVQRANGECNFINKDGKILSGEWYKNVYDFNEGFARVKRKDGLMNFIDKKGKFLSNEWFIYTYSFVNGFAKVERTNSDWVKIDKTGKLIKNLQ